ncbi:MAG: hypothetical protein D6776_04120 [Planctomycetota bacterium]|nr:MAG: hypothetical protein D6776_04120 [Planctomycetota bacterium]
MDPLELDSFLNPASREESGGDSTGEHLRPGDSEENVYALLDDRPEHELTPPRGMDTMTGSAYGFGIDLQVAANTQNSSASAPALSDVVGGDNGAERDAMQIELASGAFERPSLPTQTAKPDPAAASGGFEPPRSSGTYRAPGEASAGSETGEISAGLSSGMAAFDSGGTLAFDDGDRADLRERIRRQQRARSMRQPSVDAPRRKLGALLLIGGVLILASVLGVLSFQGSFGPSLLDQKIGVAGPEEAPHPGTGLSPIAEGQSRLTIAQRLRRALAFGLPPDAFGTVAPNDRSDRTASAQAAETDEEGR